jgi:predicted outer membrane lipoprotein
MEAMWILDLLETALWLESMRSREPYLGLALEIIDNGARPRAIA